MIYQLFLAFASIIDYSSQLVKEIPSCRAETPNQYSTIFPESPAIKER